MDENPQSQNQTPLASPPTQQQPLSNDNLSSKKPKTGLIVGIVVGVIALVGVVVSIVFAIAPLSSPSQADYKAANDHISEMRFGEDGLFMYPINKSTAKKIKEASDKLKKDSEELGKMRAVTEDKEIKESYDKFVAKLDKFMGNRTIMFEVAEISEAMKDDEYSYSDGDEEYLEIAKKLEAIAGSIKNDRNKKFVKDAIDNNKAIAVAVKKMAEAKKNSDPSPLTTDEWLKLLGRRTDSITDWLKDITKATSSNSLLKEFDKLSRLIAEKLAEKM